MAEGGSLENCCTARYRGFKSYFLRQIKIAGHGLIAARDFLFSILATRGRQAHQAAKSAYSALGTLDPIRER